MLKKMAPLPPCFCLLALLLPPDFRDGAAIRDMEEGLAVVLSTPVVEGHFR
ncbi:hypothetical protein E5676_scaffold248G004470 [Cucumis melo var. makuwa]|uniref:Uncharacterized protein n=2 Tax=Cucumis melo TaxID=3656 RepID=A0A5A7UHK8_CUCMM|nr:hypothetical protein E6C27_scaffold80G001550 [Cucumis melo var. makuwa]TYJ99236.1 hypothetical protein E5676_scaffold248G004470 [Cucumis melo var. makuwa]